MVGFWGGPLRLRTNSFSLCPHTAERTRESPGISFRRALVPFTGLHPHDLSACQRPRLRAPSPRALELQHMHLGGINIRTMDGGARILFWSVSFVFVCWFVLFLIRSTACTWFRVTYVYKTYCSMAGLPSPTFSSPEAHTSKYFSSFLW